MLEGVQGAEPGGERAERGWAGGGGLLRGLAGGIGAQEQHVEGLAVALHAGLREVVQAVVAYEGVHFAFALECDELHSVVRGRFCQQAGVAIRLPDRRCGRNRFKGLAFRNRNRPPCSTRGKPLGCSNNK